MIFTIGFNPKATTLIGVICGLGYVLYKKEKENESLRAEIKRLKMTEEV